MKQFFLFALLLPIFSYSLTKLPKDSSDEIKAFALYNYDNLIADCYEDKKPYINQLAKILSQATNVTESFYYKLLNSNEFSSESVPIKYMLLLNKKTAELSNYYFVDD